MPAKEILLYYPIYSYNVADLITQMDEALDEDISMRVNTPGGEVYYAYGLIAKFNEHEGSKKIKVDGMAFSGGAFLCCYADDVECLDVSQFMFHRAAYPEWIEANPEYFTDDVRKGLTVMNGHLRAGMEGKIDVAKFEKVTGVTLDEMFSLDSRIDVRLSAKQAKQIGLVNKIVTITPQKKAEISAMTMQIAAQWTGVPTPEATITKENIDQDMPQALTLAEILAQYPNEVKTIQDTAITAERDRVNSFLAVHKVAPEAAIKGIQDGSQMSQAQIVEFAMLAAAGAKVAEVVADNNPAIDTPEAKAEADKKTAEEKAFDAAVNAKIGKVVL